MVNYLKMVYIGFNTQETNGNISFDNVVNEFFRSFFNSNRFKSNFPVNVQHDAHEFLLSFLGYIDECVSEIELAKRGVRQDEDLIQLLNEYEKRFSFSNNNFGYMIQVFDACDNDYHYDQNRRETGFVYTLEIVNCNKLSQCLKKAFLYELEMACPVCNKTNAQFTRYQFFDQLAENLIFHYSRFKVLF